MLTSRYKRRNLYDYLLLVVVFSVLNLSIAFAAVYSQLTINSTLAIDKVNLDVYFTGAQITNDSNTTSSVDSNGNTVITSSDGKQKVYVDHSNNKLASFDVSNMVGYGETAAFEYTIYNNGDIPAKLEFDTVSTNNSTYFSVDSNINNLETTVLQPNSSTTLFIVIKVKKVLADTNHDSSKINSTATVTVKATPAEN